MGYPPNRPLKIIKILLTAETADTGGLGPTFF